MTIINLPSLAQLPTYFASQLNGKHGKNREQNLACQLRAENDYEAVQCWLNEYMHKATTYRTYQKEAEIFLLWAVVQQMKPLSSLDRDDMADYIKFLDNPQPQHLWCAMSHGRGKRRGDASWRPFKGPLSSSAKQTALSAIDSMLNYLVTARYLAFNPLSLIRKRHTRMKDERRVNALNIHDRILSVQEWHAMLDTMMELPEEDYLQQREKARLIFLVNLFYFLGLRINELVNHTWQSFKKIEDKWWFYVLGKGDKLGRIPVNDQLLRAIIIYRNFQHLSPYPEQETKPLIASFTTGEAITARQVNKILKKLALATANKFKQEPSKAEKLKKFSAHWLRHLSASMQDKAGIAFKHIRANHRHENDETTRRYVHALDDDRHEDMQKLSLRIKS